MLKEAGKKRSEAVKASIIQDDGQLFKEGDDVHNGKLIQIPLELGREKMEVNGQSADANRLALREEVTMCLETVRCESQTLIQHEYD